MFCPQLCNSVVVLWDVSLRVKRKVCLDILCWSTMLKHVSRVRFVTYESPEGTWRISQKYLSKSLFRIVQSILMDSFSRIRQYVLSDCNSCPQIGQSLLGVKIEGTNSKSRERIVLRIQSVLVFCCFVTYVFFFLIQT